MIDKLSMFEWETQVAAWRYFEYGATITSASYPHEIVQKYWGSGNPYTDEVRERIARQFAITDHGGRGEKDWTDSTFGRHSRMECDMKPWIAFYEFCKAWVEDFVDVVVKDPQTKQTETCACFHTDWNDRWLSRGEYIRRGEDHYVNPECIVSPVRVTEAGK